MSRKQNTNYAGVKGRKCHIPVAVVINEDVFKSMADECPPPMWSKYFGDNSVKQIFMMIHTVSAKWLTEFLAE